MKSTAAVRPFGLRDTLGYLLGDLGNDFTFLFSGMFMMKFYTDVVQVPSSAVGTLMMLARFLDAFTDITVGRLADRRPAGRYGKFRPWLLWGAVPTAAASCLLYQNRLAAAPLGFRIGWMTVTYILWGSVFYTVVNIPYGSMASTITRDPEQRATLSTFRTVGSVLAGMLVGTGVPLLAYTTVNGRQVLSGERTTAAAGWASLLAAVCTLLCFLLVRERTVPPAARSAPVFSALKSLLRDRALLAVVFAAVFLLFSQLTLTTVNNYVLPNVYGGAWGISFLSLAGSLLTLLICAPLAQPLSRRFGRKAVGAAACFFAAAAYGVLFFWRPADIWVFLSLSLAAQVGIGFFNMVIWAYVTDVTDRAELRLGRREDGVIYAVYSFARKLGQAAAAGTVGFLLEAVGYSASTAYEPAVLRGIFRIATLVPALGFAAAACILTFLYPLGKRQVEENTRRLQNKL